MSNPFKIGDKVKCVKQGSGVLKDHQYIIRRLAGSFQVYLEDRHSANDCDRFVLISEEVPTAPSKKEEGWGF